MTHGRLIAIGELADSGFTMNQPFQNKVMTNLFARLLGSFCWVAAWGLLAGNAAADGVPEYTAGHGDIGLFYENDELILEYWFRGSIFDGVATNARVDPAMANVRVADSAEMVAQLELPFLNTLLGDVFWSLPQSGTAAGNANPPLPFLGINSESLPNSITSAVLTLTGFDGPPATDDEEAGEFALFQFQNSIEVFMQSNDGVSEVIEGVPTGDTLVFLTHDHYIWGFTREGVYDVELTATAYFADGTYKNDVETFRFLVGSSTVIPEPGSLAALASLGLSGLVLRRQRKS